MIENLGKKIKVSEISYEIRGFVDGKYVLRIRNQKTGKERYEVWREERWEEYCSKSKNYGIESERNIQIFKKYMAGEALSNIAREHGISSTRVGEICRKQSRNNKV